MDQTTKKLSFLPSWIKWSVLGILVDAGVVAVGPQKRIQVTVMTNSEHPVKLFAGTRIGALSPVRVEEEHPDVNTVTANPPSPPKVPTQGPAAVNLDSCDLKVRKISGSKHQYSLFCTYFACA